MLSKYLIGSCVLQFLVFELIALSKNFYVHHLLSPSVIIPFEILLGIHEKCFLLLFFSPSIRLFI